MDFDQELQVAENLFRTIESVGKKAVAEGWSFDTDVVKGIVEERLGKGGKHISAFGFYKAASDYRKRPGRNTDEIASMQTLTGDKIFPKGRHSG